MAAPTLSIVCPKCGARSDNAPASFVGRTVRCPKCAVTFKVEAPAPLPTVPEPQFQPLPTTFEAGGVPPVSSPSASGRLVTQRLAEWKVGDVLLDRYEVLGVLGQGGMGTVYKVRHRGWDLALAAKVPRPTLLEVEGGAEIFEREAETWVNLGLHPHTVTCYYVRRLRGVPVLFAEFVDGGSLHERIRSGQLRTMDAMLDVGIQFAWGLHYAHEQGLVHLDVKPHNVMLTSDGLAKVTDFGMARARRFKPDPKAAPIGPSKSGETLSVDGAVGGTAAYMSPEHSAHRTLTRRSDLWSWGLSILEMFAGFRFWDWGIAARDALDDHLAHPADGLPPLPDAVVDLLRRCFREDPEERPRTLADAAAVLLEAYETATGRPYPHTPPRSGQGTPDTLNNRAVSLLDLGREAEGAALFKRALEAQPQHLEATYNQCLTSWTAGHLDDDEALRRMGEACTTHADVARAHQLRGRLHWALGDPAHAVAALDEAARRGVVSPDLDRSLGQALLAVSPGDPGRALACFERLRDAGSTEPADVVGRAFALVRLGRELEARRFYDEAARDDSDWPRDLATAVARFLPGHEEGVSLRGLAGAASALAVSSDGSLVVAGHGHEVRVWDAAKGALARAPLKGEAPVRALAVTPDGRFLFWSGENAPITVWDLEAGRAVRGWQRHPGYATAVALVPDGRHAVTGGSDRLVRVFDVVSGECLRVLEGHEDAVTSVAVGATRAASGSRDGTVRVWDLGDGRCLGTLRGHGGRVSAVVLDEEQAQVISAGDDRTLRLWGLRSLELVRTFVGHSQPVTALCLAAGRSLVWSGSLDRTARAWDLDRERVHSLVRLDAAVQAIAAGRDGGVFVAHGASISAVRPVERRPPPLALARPASALEVATHSASFEGRTEEAQRRLEAGDLAAAADAVRAARAIPGHERAPGALSLWDELQSRLPRRGLTSAWEEGKLEGHEDQVLGLAASADGRRLLSAGQDQVVRVWDLAGARCVSTLSGHEALVAAVALSGDGRLAASGSWDRTIRLWDLASGRGRRTLEGHEDHVTSVACSPDGAWVVSGSRDQTVRLWRPASGSAKVLAGHESHVSAVAFGPDGHFVVSAAWDATARAWDVESGRAVCLFEGHEGNVTAVAVSPSGRHVATGGEDRTVRLFEMRSRKCLETLPGHEAEVTALAFTADGRYLFSASKDHSVRVWDLERGAPARTLPHAAPVLALSLSPSGHRAYSGGADRVIRAWHLDWELGAPPKAATRGEAAAPAPSDWEEVRRTRPVVPLRPAPAVAKAVRRIPWGRMALAFAALVGIAIGVSSWFKPKVTLRVVPYMAKTVLAALDPIDLAAFTEPCNEPREVYRERSRAPEVSAPTLSCLARTGEPAVATDYLADAPLEDPSDPLRDRRLFRNAVSLMLGLGDAATEPLCGLLGDSRERVRRIASVALARSAHPASTACLLKAISDGDAISRATAASVLDLMLAKGEVKSPEGFAVAQGLVRDADPAIRVVGIRTMVMFNADFAAPAVTAAAADPDPSVAQAAKETLASIESIKKVDLLRSGS